jgi:hypothetical protein
VNHFPLSVYCFFLQPTSTSCKHLFLGTFIIHMNGMARWL